MAFKDPSGDIILSGLLQRREQNRHDLCQIGGGHTEYIKGLKVQKGIIYNYNCNSLGPALHMKKALPKEFLRPQTVVKGW